MQSISDDKVLSFSGDMCEDGTITVVLAFGAFLLLAGLKVALSRFTAAHTKTDERKSSVRRLVKNSRLEDILVLPFVPTTVEHLVLAIYGAWFAMTITMGVTRYYEKRWGNDVLAQQSLFNIIANFLGCKGLDMMVIPYAYQEPEPTARVGGFFRKNQKSSLEMLCEKNPLECSSDIDFYFGHHLFFGIVWLSFGAMQIYLSRNGWSDNEIVRRKAHTLFGIFVAVPAFLAHLTMASLVAFRNPVNQAPFIAMQYWAMIAESLLLCANGIYFARQHNYPMHAVRMFFCWIQSVVGSGSIRITAWVLWMIGKFFSMETRILIDRGACQNMAISGYPQWGIGPSQIGSAEHCYKSVFLNLAVTDALTLWLEWVFLCLPIAKWDKSDRAATVGKFKLLVVLSAMFLLMVFVFDSPDWLIQGVISVWAFFVKMNTFRMYIASFLKEPADAPQTWAMTAKKSLLKIYFVEQPDDIEVEGLHED